MSIGSLVLDTRIAFYDLVASSEMTCCVVYCNVQQYMAIGCIPTNLLCPSHQTRIFTKKKKRPRCSFRSFPGRLAPKGAPWIVWSSSWTARTTKSSHAATWCLLCQAFYSPSSALYPTFKSAFRHQSRVPAHHGQFPIWNWFHPSSHWQPLARALPLLSSAITFG